MVKAVARRRLCEGSVSTRGLGDAQHNSASSVHVVVSLSFFAGVSYSDPTDAELLAAADEVDPPSEYTF